MERNQNRLVSISLTGQLFRSSIFHQEQAVAEVAGRSRGEPQREAPDKEML